jgi:hypothetical protein
VDAGIDDQAYFKVGKRDNAEIIFQVNRRLRFRVSVAHPMGWKIYWPICRTVPAPLTATHLD